MLGPAFLLASSTVCQTGQVVLLRDALLGLGVSEPRGGEAAGLGRQEVGVRVRRPWRLDFRCSRRAKVIAQLATWHDEGGTLRVNFNTGGGSVKRLRSLTFALRLQLLLQAMFMGLLPCSP